MSSGLGGQAEGGAPEVAEGGQPPVNEGGAPPVEEGPYCGDGVVQPDDEQCDDKNQTSGDGCSETCTVEPVQVVALGANSMCGLGSNGQIRCFSVGSEDWEHFTVVLGAGEKAKKISGNWGGAAHLCALLESGKVRCWGNNDFGQLGIGDKVPRTFDQPGGTVDLGSDAIATDIAVGNRFSCATLSDGKVRCWGDNQFDQLGFAKNSTNPNVGDANGEMGEALLPVPQSLGRATASVIAFDLHACAVRSE